MSGRKGFGGHLAERSCMTIGESEHRLCICLETQGPTGDQGDRTLENEELCLEGKYG